MAKKFLTPIDLNQLELQNARLQNLATAPSSPVKGQMYYNTTSNKALVWDGTAWIPWEVGGVTGVKGDSESTYRTGNVNITKANIGLGNVDNTADANKTVSKANILTTARDIDGVSFNGSSAINHIASVNMSGSGAVTYDSTNNRCLIAVSKSGFTPANGSVLYITFTNYAQVPSGASNTTPAYFKFGSNYVRIQQSYKGGSGSPFTINNAVDKFKNGATYGFVFSSASLCDIIGETDTNTTYNAGTQESLEAGTSTTNLIWSSKILHDYIADVVGGVDAMRFKGTIGTGGTITTLPTTGVKVGDTYRVITAGTYAGQTCEIGDLIIATATTPTWTVAQTNIDGAITSISGTAPISVTGSGSSRTVSISDATTSASGAMSSSDKTKLNGIATGAEVNQNAFSNVAVSGQTTVAADSKTDTLTLAAGSNITLTTDATNDKVTIGTSAEVNQNAFSNVKVGTTTVSADSKTDTLELVAGTNITLTPDATNDKITIATNPELLVFETSVTIGTNATSTTYTHKEPEKYTEDGKMLLDYTAYMNGAEVVVDHTQTRTAVRESGITQYYNVTETFSVASSPSSAITIKIHYRTWTR